MLCYNIVQVHSALDTEQISHVKIVSLVLATASVLQLSIKQT